MAREVREFTFTVAAGTTEATATRQRLVMPARVVRRVTLRVPPGPRGVLGVAIANAGVPVIPLTPGQWIVTDDVELPFTTDGYVDSGTWWVTGYNTGAYPHTVTIRFEVTPPVTGAAGKVQTAPGTAPVVGMTGSGGTPVTPGTTPVQVVAPPPPPTVTAPAAPTAPSVTLPTLPAPPVVTMPTLPATPVGAPPSF